MIKLIINSDDFGLNSSVNKAIYASFEKGLISSATLLTNFQGFDEAVEMITANSLLSNSVGIHVNLTEGIALTNDIKRCPRFCNSDGLFIKNKQSPILLLEKNEEVAVYREIKEQISKVINVGIEPTHVDSHHHVHTEIGILRVLLQVSGDLGIGKMRISRNIGINPPLLKIVYKKILNYYMSKHMLTTNYFGSINDFLFSEKYIYLENAVIELMVHAMIDEHENVVDSDLKRLDKKILPLASRYNMISFSQYTNF